MPVSSSRRTRSRLAGYGSGPGCAALARSLSTWASDARASRGAHDVAGQPETGAPVGLDIAMFLLRSGRPGRGPGAGAVTYGHGAGPRDGAHGKPAEHGVLGHDTTRRYATTWPSRQVHGWWPRRSATGAGSWPDGIACRTGGQGHPAHRRRGRPWPRLHDVPAASAGSAGRIGPFGPVLTTHGAARSSQRWQAQPPRERMPWPGRDRVASNEVTDVAIATDRTRAP